MEPLFRTVFVDADNIYVFPPTVSQYLVLAPIPHNDSARPSTAEINRVIVLWVFFCPFEIPLHNKQHPGTNEWQGISKGGGLLLFIEKE